MKKSYIVDSSYEGTRIDKWIRNFLGKVPQGLIEKSLRIGKIKLNNKKISKTFKDIIWDCDIKLLGGVKNLFDERQSDFQENGEERDVTYFYGPSRPRSFYLAGEILF